MFYHKKTIFLLLPIVSVSFTTFTSTEHEWVLKKKSNDVSVYSRKVDHESIKELKAVTQLKTSLSSIIAVMNDKESYPQWVYRCGKASILKKISDIEVINYQNVISPWPVENRDIVIHVTTQQNEITKVVILRSISQPYYIPKVPGCIRVMIFNSSWTLTPLKNGMVNCENILLLDPEGDVPAWLVNLVAVEGPYETTAHLRQMVMKEKYQKTHCSFIKEPD